MKDLYRCLDEYPMPLLRAIAAAWEIDLAEGDPKEIARRLADAMLSPGALAKLIERLSPEARSALANLARGGGKLPARRLTLIHGSIQRLGPARLEREQPWLQPENTLQELYYKGLLHRAYGQIDEYAGEILFVPIELLERLPQDELRGPELTLEAIAAPPHIRSDGRAMAEDLLAVLVRIRQGQTPLSSRGTRPEAISPSLDEMDLGPRLLGEAQPARLALIRRLLWQLHLIEAQRGALQPSQRAREWLRLPDRRRLASLYRAWRDDPHWDELRLIPTLRSEDGEWPGNPVAARRNLLALLARCPAETWLSLDDFVQALKRLRPDYLRADGDFDRGRLRDAQTNELLSGFESWERVEGALARYLIGFSLRWLGIVQVGALREGEPPVAFCVTTPGRALLADGAELPAQDKGTLTPQATVNEDFQVTIPIEGTMYDRYQLERFAEWLAQDTEAAYRITAESVWESQNAGVKTEQIANFLKRVSGERVPPVVLHSLLAWGGRFGRVTLRRMVVVQVDDVATLQQISARPEIRALFVEMLSPTLCLADEANLEELIKRLKDLGIWPRVRA